MTVAVPSPTLGLGIQLSGRPDLLPGISAAEESNMATEQVDQSVVTTDPVTPAGPEVVRSSSVHTSTTSPSGQETTRRIFVFAFGLISVLIGARIILLLLDAREANGLVSFILSASQVLVAPFDGILRTDNLNASASVLDVTAIVALVGWGVLELIVLWAIGIVRREPA